MMEVVFGVLQCMPVHSGLARPGPVAAGTWPGSNALDIFVLRLRLDNQLLQRGDQIGKALALDRDVLA